MRPQTKLAPSMTLVQFDNGYWYATELRAFAKSIGIRSSSQLRKDELEQAIKAFLITGESDVLTTSRPSRSGVRDVDHGLSCGLQVAVYTNDRETKDFLEREALRLCGNFKRKSGARYRLNRWREARVANGLKITYLDLVREYVRLCQTAGPFAQVPHGRYINFLSDFMAGEPDASRGTAIAAWKTLKALHIPKDYRSWKEFESAKRK